MSQGLTSSSQETPPQELQGDCSGPGMSAGLRGASSWSGAGAGGRAALGATGPGGAQHAERPLRPAAWPGCGGLVPQWTAVVRPPHRHPSSRPCPPSLSLPSLPPASRDATLCPQILFLTWMKDPKNKKRQGFFPQVAPEFCTSWGGWGSSREGLKHL